MNFARFLGTTTLHDEIKLENVNRNNLVILSARPDNIFGCVSYSNIRLTNRVNKINKCLFLNTNAVNNAIINNESYTA